MRIAHPVGVTVPLRVRSVKDRGEGGYSWHVFMIHKVAGAMETIRPAKLDGNGALKSRPSKEYLQAL